MLRRTIRPSGTDLVCALYLAVLFAGPAAAQEARVETMVCEIETTVDDRTGTETPDYGSDTWLLTYSDDAVVNLQIPFGCAHAPDPLFVSAREIRIGCRQTVGTVRMTNLAKIDRVSGAYRRTVKVGDSSITHKGRCEVVAE